MPASNATTSPPEDLVLSTVKGYYQWKTKLHFHSLGTTVAYNFNEYKPTESREDTAKRIYGTDKLVQDNCLESERRQRRIEDCKFDEDFTKKLIRIEGDFRGRLTWYNDLIKDPSEIDIDDIDEFIKDGFPDSPTRQEGGVLDHFLSKQQDLTEEGIELMRSDLSAYHQYLTLTGSSKPADRKSNVELIKEQVSIRENNLKYLKVDQGLCTAYTSNESLKTKIKKVDQELLSLGTKLAEFSQLLDTLSGLTDSKLYTDRLAERKTRFDVEQTSSTGASSASA